MTNSPALPVETLPRVLLVGARYRDDVERAVQGGALCVALEAFPEVIAELPLDDFDCILVDASLAGATAQLTRLKAQFPDREFLLLCAGADPVNEARAAGLEAIDAAAEGALSRRLAGVTSDYRIAAAFARQASLGIRNAAYKELLEAFTERANRQTIAAIGAMAAQRLLLAQGATVLRAAGAKLECLGASGIMSPLVGESQPLGASQVLERNAGRLIPETSLLSARSLEWAVRCGSESAAAAPIRGRGEVIGVLTVNSIRRHAFADADLISLQGVADLVAIGLALAEGEELRTAFLRDLIIGVEDERRRLATDLHDDAGQLLTALLVNLHGLEPYTDPSGRGRLIEAQQLASRTLVELQRIARGVRPAVTHELSFEQAVKRLGREHEAAHGTKVDAIFNGVLGAASLPMEIEVALYRTVQESLSNVARHAQAKAVGIVVRRTGDKVLLIIEDDGVGMAPLAHAPGTGLAQISERIALLNGKFTLESSPGMGTALYVEVPLGGGDGQNPRPGR